ncbi:hypothetical protein [Ensifer soli]|uniref:hypothetical protein n=1 Tax=Ciceribacter sp. sgz301302 TaxID=3342379 RepID=UPI0035B7F275
MEHIAAIMVLVGCVNGQCAQVQTPVDAFESAQDCQEMLRPAVSKASDDYSITYGKCASVDPALEFADMSVRWRITPDDQLDITIAFDQPYAIATIDHVTTGAVRP